MNIELEYTKDLQIVSEPIPYDKENKQYYIRWRVYLLFGLIKYWQYMLRGKDVYNDGYRTFYSLESAKRYLPQDVTYY